MTKFIFIKIRTFKLHIICQSQLNISIKVQLAAITVSNFMQHCITFDKYLKTFALIHIFHYSFASATVLISADKYEAGFFI